MLQFVELDRGMLNEDLVSELDQHGLRFATRRELDDGLEQLPDTEYPIEYWVLEGRDGSVFGWCHTDVANAYFRRYTSRTCEAGMRVAVVPK